MATKTNQDYINENRLLRKSNMEADKEISQLRKQLEEKEKELSEAKKTISFYKEELLKAQILTIAKDVKGKWLVRKRFFFIAFPQLLSIRNRMTYHHDRNSTEFKSVGICLNKNRLY